MRWGNPYLLAKTIFWSLPGPLREHLHGLRHRFVRLWRSRKFVSTSCADSGVNWVDFCENVLDRRDSATPVIVFEPTIDWGVTLFQRPQHMAMALGRKGCIVLYRTTGDGVVGVREVAPNVWLVNTPELSKLRGAIWSIYSTASLYTPKLMAERRIDGRVVYEYIDHIDSTISGSKAEVKRLRALKTAACSGQADFLIASSKALHSDLSVSGAIAPLAYIPNGVDVDHFRDIRHRKTPLAERFLEFKKRYRKIVGYFGAIAPWLWFEAMACLAEKMPDVGFVYIGPDYGGQVGRLPRISNVLYLGAIDYEILPAYAQEFDVGFIPFIPGAIAKTTSPLKLFEFFALEKPVVVTADMEECTSFPVVFSGKSTESFIDAIEEAFFAGKDPDYRKAVLGLGHANSWDIRAESYLSLINQSQ